MTTNAGLVGLATVQLVTGDDVPRSSTGSVTSMALPGLGIVVIGSPLIFVRSACRGLKRWPVATVGERHLSSECSLSHQ
jgi:hypothetical protein